MRFNFGGAFRTVPIQKTMTLREHAIAILTAMLFIWCLISGYMWLRDVRFLGIEREDARLITLISGGVLAIGTITHLVLQLISRKQKKQHAI